MPTEQRVISSKTKIAPKGGAGAAAETVDEVPAKRSKKTMILAIVVLLLLAGGAAYWFLLKPSAGAAEAEPAEPEHVAGAVQVVDSVSINLSGGHYLRLGLGLQLTEEVHEDVDTAKALDLAIALFSQRSLEEVSDATERDALKAELLHQLEEAYEGEVMDVYFTDFVSQ
ncbi:flagellar basal body-associated protein FliL [Actinotalea sp.]|uniref:flagellar basal body-associated FliL family protein n=1 Tax=Actinotalea sp. TaxID=1872145 RepID=UPI00356A98DA